MMKCWTLLTIGMLALTITACGDDDDGVIDSNALRYDGDNANSPALPIGSYRAGVYFPPSYTANFSGRQLEAVEFYVWDLPAKAEIKVYADNNTSVPGVMIFSSDVTADISPRSWHTVTLDAPIDIADGLWLTYEWDNPVDGGQSMGCDAGPGTLNGDWLYNSNDGLWQSYISRFQESINWNIRGRLSE